MRGVVFSTIERIVQPPGTSCQGIFRENPPEKLQFDSKRWAIKKQMTQSNSYPKKWALLYSIYKETNRGGVVKSLHKNLPLSKSWPYKITVLIYVGLSFGIFYLASKDPKSLLLVFVLIAGIYAWLDCLISLKYREIYEIHGLKLYPFFQRSSNLSYILFVNKLNDSDLSNIQALEALQKWQERRSDKYSTLSYFNTPIVLILMTMSSSLALEYLKSQNILVSKYILPILALICIVLWFGWSIYDAFRTNDKINRTILNYLKCYLIENQENLKTKKTKPNHLLLSDPANSAGPIEPDDGQQLRMV